MPRLKTLDALQEAEVLRRAQFGASCRELAAHFRVSAMTISRLLRGHPQQVSVTGLQLPYMPPIISVVGKLAIIEVDPDLWHVHSIMEQFQISHAIAVGWLTRFALHLRLQGYSHLFLWKDETQSTALAAMIRHKTGEASQVLNARACAVARVDKAESAQFYKTNHLQGSANTVVDYGLYHNRVLVACMGFNQSGACRGLEGYHLLQRFSAVGNVRGAASRLLKAFRSENPGPILSYSDERYAPGGGLYAVLGFRCEKKHKPDYRYWRDNRWYAKNTKQRRHLIAEGGIGETEHEMAHSLGYKRCYDLGKKTWVLP